MNSILLGIGGVLVAVFGFVFSILKHKLKKTEEKVDNLETSLNAETKNKQIAQKAIEEIKTVFDESNKIDKKTEEDIKEGEKAYIDYIDNWNNGN